MKIETKADLIAALAKGDRPQYTFFWGHQPPKTGVSRSCLSQWYATIFEIDGITYHSAEQYMMSEKARLFSDEDTLKEILATTDPSKAKKLGRQVKNFDNSSWIGHRFEIVVAANLAKFKQSPSLRSFLLSTEETVIVEASPYDKIWGIGLRASHPHSKQPNKWPGLNLLGFALMKVRNTL